MVNRRRIVAALAVQPMILAMGGMAAGTAWARSRPPDRHFRLNPMMLPVPQTGPFTYARVVADLVLDQPTSRDAVLAIQPRLVGMILRESWDLPVGTDGRISAQGAKALKERILRISQDVVGPQVQDVLIVSLIIG